MIAMTHTGYIAAGGSVPLPRRGYASPSCAGPQASARCHRGAPVELTPRTLDDEVTAEEGDVPAGRRRRPPGARRHWLPLVVLGVVMLGLGLLVYKGLSDAALYFRNADEAVAQRDELGTRRFRLQGTVVGEPVAEGGTVSFDVTYNGVDVAVVHPARRRRYSSRASVVLEALAQGADVFDSDRILVKHDRATSQDGYDERIDVPSGAAEPAGERRSAPPDRPGRRRLGRGPRDVAVALAQASGTCCRSATRTCCWLFGAVLAVGAMERALIRDSRCSTWPTTAAAAPPSTTSPPCGGARRVDPAVGAHYTVTWRWWCKFRRQLDDPLVGWAMLTMFVVSGFSSCCCCSRQPVRRFDPGPGFDGGAQPAAANHPLMAFHPPALYYVGFTVPFALPWPRWSPPGGRGWLLETRRWTLFAWGFLTLASCSVRGGAEVLNWGGYWGWDGRERLAAAAP
jgi:cytochrome c-type biogenesis protein CcmE